MNTSHTNPDQRRPWLAWILELAPPCPRRLQRLDARLGLRAPFRRATRGRFDVRRMERPQTLGHLLWFPLELDELSRFARVWSLPLRNLDAIIVILPEQRGHLASAPSLSLLPGFRPNMGIFQVSSESADACAGSLALILNRLERIAAERPSFGEWRREREHGRLRAG